MGRCFEVLLYPPSEVVLQNSTPHSIQSQDGPVNVTNVNSKAKYAKMDKPCTHVDELDDLLAELGDEWFHGDLNLSAAKAVQRNQPQSHTKTVGKLQPAKEPTKMVVPKTVAEVTRLVHLATQKIWKNCKLGRGPRILADRDKPDIPLGIYAEGMDLETQSKRSYRMVDYMSQAST